MITIANTSRRTSFEPESFHYRVDYVGRERQPVLIIDNVFQQAEKLVDYCIGNLNFHNADSFYPGIRMSGPQGYDKFLAVQLRPLIQRVFGMPIDRIRGARSVYSMVVTPPEKLGLFQRIPHCDSADENTLACVHYLCSPEHGGTSLYRHVSTGFENVNAQRQDAYRNALQADLERQGMPSGYINGSTPIFERTASYEAAFNRLVMYRGFNFHSGNIAADFPFDSNPGTGRLTLNTFYYF